MTLPLDGGCTPWNHSERRNLQPLRGETQRLCPERHPRQGGRRPVWVKCRMTTGLAGAQTVSGLASLSLPVKGAPFLGFVTTPGRSRFWVLPRKLDPSHLRGLGRWRGKEAGGSHCFEPGGKEGREGSPEGVRPPGPGPPLSGRGPVVLSSSPLPSCRRLWAHTQPK